MWICQKCGTKASSKCPDHRQVFMEDQIAAMMTWVMKVPTQTVHPVERESGGIRYMNHAELHMSIGSSTDDRGLALFEALRWIKEKTDSTLLAYACDHKWVAETEEHRTCQLGHEHDVFDPDALAIQLDDLATSSAT